MVFCYQAEISTKHKGEFAMVRVIMGARGAGKTKQMIELITKAGEEEAGYVIALERGRKLADDIHARTARLIDTQKYDIRSYQVLRGFITGLYAGNFDISHIFIDSLLKIAASDDMAEFEKFIDWLSGFGEQNQISFTVTASADPGKASDGVRKYFI
jgi:hypothetical protein